MSPTHTPGSTSRLRSTALKFADGPELNRFRTRISPVLYLAQPPSALNLVKNKFIIYFGKCSMNSLKFPDLFYCHYFDMVVSLMLSRYDLIYDKCVTNVKKNLFITNVVEIK